METQRYIECLAADTARLREVAAIDLSAPVPSCPGWSADDLVRHVAVVYLHKAETMRGGGWPDPWPPDTTAEPALELLDRAHATLVGEFAQRRPEQHSVTWFDPDQTVGFWIRRMAQEAVIHRVDGELAAKVEVAAIPDDLAVDGIDEVLIRFLAWASVTWPEDFDDRLSKVDDRPLVVSAGGLSWQIRATPAGVVVTGEALAAPAARIHGSPQAVLLWLWRRADVGSVSVEGDQVLVEQLWTLLDPATQ
jgi:hypothetical protein